MNPEDFQETESELEALFKKSGSSPSPNPSDSDARIQGILDRVKVHASMKGAANFAIKGTGETASELFRGVIKAFLPPRTPTQEKTD